MGRFSQIASLLFAAHSVLGAEWIGEVNTVDGIEYQCKCYSDNACWPTNKDWEKLNETVSGALQVALPPGAVCHKNLGNSTTSFYDAAKCAEVQANWGNEQYLYAVMPLDIAGNEANIRGRTDHPTANLWPIYTNNTCLPSDDPSTPCTRGFYGQYVIVAKTKDQIKAGVDFARERNLRLIIRNTGHDFMYVEVRPFHTA